MMRPESAHQQPLDDDSDQPHERGRDYQNRNPEIDSEIGRRQHRKCTEHEEFAVREVDDPHHAENDRKPGADERQACD